MNDKTDRDPHFRAPLYQNSDLCDGPGMMRYPRLACAWGLLWPFLILLLTGCGDEPTGMTALFPNSPAGWTETGTIQIFDRENLFDLVDGQAEAFFAYGFEQVAVQSYENGDGATLRVTIWQLATPADAYGLFTTNAFGTPVDIGNGGNAEPGQRLVFWQERYYVDLFASPPLDDARVLEAHGKEMSAQLPSGGEHPALIERLPASGLVEHSTIFFHEEISIQDRLWLGGEDLLGLGPETDGVLARYSVGGAEVQLLLVQYPNADAASAGLAALQKAGFDSLRASGVQNDLLGTVWGELDEITANRLLAETLGSE
jgi:hypothetical protein